MAAALFLAITLLAAPALGQTAAGDVAALSGLQACVSRAAQGNKLPFLMGWNTQASTGRKLLQTTPATPTNVPGVGNINNLLNGVPGVPPSGASSPATSSTPGVPATPSGIPATPTGTSSDPCGTTGSPIPWTGILCANNRVQTINMAALGPNALSSCDVGTLGGLSGLTAATSINMQAVGLTGQLPSNWSTGFTALQMLTLSQNNIEGSLPSSWAQGFPALNTLDLNQNGISGMLPSAWGSAGAFPDLLNLVLGNNSLDGVLPLWTDGFPKAQLFGLAANQFSGVLPDRWAFPDLLQLQLENNMFDGCLPGSWVENMPNLTHLNVANNDLNGAIPPSYANANMLTVFTITPGNSFCGDISATLAMTPAPETQGNRFQPEPTTKNSAGGYTLPSCPANLVCPAYTPPGPSAAPAMAPSAATPAVSTAGRRLLASA